MTAPAVEQSVAAPMVVVPKEPTKNLKRKRARVEKWDTYIHKMLLKQHSHMVPDEKGARPKLTIDRRTMRIFNSLVEETFQMIVEELRRLMKFTERSTLHEKDVFLAGKLILRPIKKCPDLYKSALIHAKRAIDNYNQYKPPADPSKPPKAPKAPKAPKVKKAPAAGGTVVVRKKKKSTKSMLPRTKSKKKKNTKKAAAGGEAAAAKKKVTKPRNKKKTTAATAAAPMVTTA